jgi:nitrogen fixation NifU-like protein
MTEAVKGKDKAAVMALYGKIHALLTQQDAVPDASLGKLAALCGVREFPARVKCASLCWHTLGAALESGTTTVTTE